MAKTKRKMTKKYWKSLERRTRNKAILMIFGSQAMADMLTIQSQTKKEYGK